MSTLSDLRRQADTLAARFTPDDKGLELAELAWAIQILAHRVSEAPPVGPDDPGERKAWALYCLCNGPEHWDNVPPEVRERNRKHVAKWTANPDLIEQRHADAQRLYPSADIRRALGLPAAS